MHREHLFQFGIWRIDLTFSLLFPFPAPARLKVLGDKRKTTEPAPLQSKSRWTPASSPWWTGRTGNRCSASIGWMPSKNRTAIQVILDRAGYSDKAPKLILFVMSLIGTVAQVWCTCLEKCGSSRPRLTSAAVLQSGTLRGPCTSCLENM